MSLLVNNDMRLEVLDLTDEDGNLVTGATVQATLFQADRSTQVAGFSQPVTLSDDGGGDYSGTIPDTADLTVGQMYWIKITADDGVRKLERWRQEEAEYGRF